MGAEQSATLVYVPASLGCSERAQSSDGPNPLLCYWVAEHGTLSRMPNPEKKSEQPAPRKPGSMEQIAKYSELALVMPAGAVGGWIVGAFLDHRFGTHWIYLLGLVLGAIGGFVRVVRVAVEGSRER